MKWEASRQKILQTLRQKFGDQVDNVLEQAELAGVTDQQLRLCGSAEGAVQLIMNKSEEGRRLKVAEHVEQNQKLVEAGEEVKQIEKKALHRIENRIREIGDRYYHPDHQLDEDVQEVRESFKTLFPGKSRAAYTGPGEAHDAPEPEGEPHGGAGLMNIRG